MIKRIWYGMRITLFILIMAFALIGWVIDDTPKQPEPMDEMTYEEAMAEVEAEMEAGILWLEGVIEEMDKGGYNDKE